jgi:hypothetical protein
VDFDLSGVASGKLFVLEHKAPFLDTRRDPTARHHYLEIDVGRGPQLWQNCTRTSLAGLVWYVLPAPPYEAALAAGASALLPIEATSRLAGHQWSGSRPCEEWFYLVRAQDLYDWLQQRTGGRGFMPSSPSLGARAPSGLIGMRSFQCDELVNDPPQHIMTLSEWLHGIRECHVGGGRVSSGRLVHIGELRSPRGDEVLDPGRPVDIQPDEPSERIGEGRKRSRLTTSGTTWAVLVPGDELGW